MSRLVLALVATAAPGLWGVLGFVSACAHLRQPQVAGPPQPVPASAPATQRSRLQLILPAPATQGLRTQRIPVSGGALVLKGAAPSADQMTDESDDERAAAARAAKRAAVAAAAMTPELDEIASQVLRGYDPATHRVATVMRPRRLQDGSSSTDQHHHVTSVHGDQTTAEGTDFIPGTVTIGFEPGADWAAEYALARVVVGQWPGLCDDEQGWLALVDRRAHPARVLAFRPLQGGCGQEDKHQFFTAAGQQLLVAEERGSGEEPIAHVTTIFWRFAGGQLTEVLSVESGEFPGTRDSNLYVESTFRGTPAGIEQVKTWKRCRGYSLRATCVTTRRRTFHYEWRAADAGGGAFVLRRGR